MFKHNIFCSIQTDDDRRARRNTVAYKRDRTKYGRLKGAMRDRIGSELIPQGNGTD